MEWSVEIRIPGVLDGPVTVGEARPAAGGRLTFCPLSMVLIWMSGL